MKDAPEKGILARVGQNPNQKPNTNLKTIAIVAGIVGTLIGMYYNEKRRTAPPPRYEQPSGSGEMRPRPESDARPGRSDASRASRDSSASRASAGTRADFDFYLLAMSTHEAFCADGHRDKPECRAGSRRPLVIHGLWPEKLEPRAYPHDCRAAPVDLEPALARELAGYMPGMQSGLHQHEWRKHGGCSGLDDDEYFRRALELARHLDEALGKSLTINAGNVVKASELRGAAEALERGLGASLTFHCQVPAGASGEQSRRPWLMEVRQCLDDNGANGGPGAPLDCARVNRRDQGCGGSFRIAGDLR